MAAIKSYTDLEQSKRLAEILPLESADMRYGYIAPYDYSDRMYDGGYDEIPYPKDFLIKNPNFSANEYDAELPCWSLAALINLLPSSLKDETGIEFSLSMDKEYIEYSNHNFSSLYSTYMHTCGNDNLIDACYEMILELKKLNLL